MCQQPACAKRAGCFFSRDRRTPIAAGAGATETGKDDSAGACVSFRILGLDPGLARMGWGIIDVSGTRLTHVAHGVLRSDAKAELPQRLLYLHQAIAEVIERLRPAALAIEQAFVAKDASAALKLGQARAVVLLVAARKGLAIAEYAPNHIKKSVVGAGHAEKAQVQAMIRHLLPTAQVESADAADALACAIAHAHFSGTRAKILAALAGEMDTRLPSGGAGGKKVALG
ncbi:MAG: crossover junction endodeoxyribonuclease RuvC [Alphaproteobacteria bacterium]|nr:crossover junction endodeoxyribonuclease RuvC [Alphaproteobacteria bacterium]